MKTLDYQTVRDAGYDDEQIQKWLVGNPDVKLANYKKEQALQLNQQMAPTIQERIKNIAPATTQQQTQSEIIQEATKTILPKQFPLTQEFGRYAPSLYRGITADMRNPGADFGTPEGTEVNLPEGQWVVEEEGTGYNQGWGNSILVKNPKTGDRIRI